MEIGIRIIGSKEEIRPALDEWVEELEKVTLELAGKEVKTPFGSVPVPVMIADYEETEEGFLLKVKLPFPDSRIMKALLWPSIRNAKKQLKKYFESRGIEAKIK